LSFIPLPGANPFAGSRAIRDLRRAQIALAFSVRMNILAVALEFGARNLRNRFA
jgi:hypothetical protein